MTAYRRGEIGLGDELAAAALGLLAGAAAFYLARLWLRREALPTAGGEREATEGRRRGSGQEVGREDAPPR